MQSCAQYRWPSGILLNSEKMNIYIHQFALVNCLNKPGCNSNSNLIFCFNGMLLQPYTSILAHQHPASTFFGPILAERHLLPASVLFPPFLPYHASDKEGQPGLVPKTLLSWTPWIISPLSGKNECKAERQHRKQIWESHFANHNTENFTIYLMDMKHMFLL